MARQRRRNIAIAAVAGLALAAVASAAALAATGTTRGHPSTDNRPTAIVSLGDSAISGEGAGSYQPGTDGPTDYCHRSTKALIHQTGIKVDRSINLACSGATAEDLQLGDARHYSERSQAAQLAPVARKYHVTMLAVEVGANDDPDFADVITDCVLAWANPLGAGCRQDDGPAWSRHVKAMVPRVERTIRDLRTVMHRAGYANRDYQFVLMSYASPVTEKMALTHAVDGCPLRKDDAKWGRTVAVPQLSDALGTAAAATGVRFLSLAQASVGHEACHAGSKDPWQNGITVDTSDISDRLPVNVVQQSFHPNARGQQEFGRCLGQFYRMSERSGRCVVGADGNLHARAD